MFSAEEKIRIILEGLRGEQSIADLCRREGIHTSIYYKWSKAFLEAGKRQLTGDTIREAGSEEVNEIRSENEALKQLFAELSLRKWIC
jgi:transposase